MPKNETARLGLPLLMPSQAQKHVTVNESLMRLDGLVNLVLQSLTRLQPPAAVIDAQCWGVPVGASGDWTGQAGRIAVGSNGGWIFLPVAAGTRAFVSDRGVSAIHDGTGWIVGAVTMGQLGAALTTGLAEGEVTVAAGASFDTGVAIPSNAMVIGAVARVTQAIQGSLNSWRLGTPGAEDRFGAGIGKAKNSWARGMLGTPTTYYQPETLRMTAEGGQFQGGRVSLAVHWLALGLPA